MASQVRLDPAREPKIEILKLRDEKCKFVLSGTDASVANGLRRALMAEVPIFAIELVNIYENSSVMHDEFLAHRLGLIPLRWKTRDQMPAELWKMPDECECDFEESDVCPRCCVMIELYKENTERTEGSSIPVTSEDLNIIPIPTSRDDVPNPLHHLEVAHFVSQEEAQTCSADAGIIINKLGPGQKVHVLAIARLGVGKMHAKFNPTATVSMKYEPVITIHKDLVDRLSRAERKQFVAENQTGVFRYDAASKQIIVENARKANNIDEIRKIGMRIARAKGFHENIVEATFVPDKFTFTVETTGCMPPDQIVECALTGLTAKLAYLADRAENLQGGARSGY